MTAMNVVHMRVKPGKVDDYIRIHKEMAMTAMPGARSFWAVQTGERDFIVVGEWDSLDAMAKARSDATIVLTVPRKYTVSPSRWIFTS